MKLIFVHGWSVADTRTYGQLPQALTKAASAFNLKINIQHIHLGKYISFHDEVSVDDISRAMQTALHELPGNANKIQAFSCITHSTGGPVVRHWIDKFYGAKNLNELPLKHLVMLAPANHGSSLAILGKARVGRIKAWWNNIEPGQRVLDWLCLGSDGQWSLNERYLKYQYAKNSFYPFVLSGQGIDNSFYDFLNDYLIEPGSDGVVRVTGANMNYRYLTLVQNIEQKTPNKPNTFQLIAKGNIKKSQPVPLGIYKKYSHSGKTKGIMQSVKAEDINNPVVQDILQCLKVSSNDAYKKRHDELHAMSNKQQAGEDTYCMLVFNIRDDHGNQIKDQDYDLFLLAGDKYKENKLPQGFFKDRQMNPESGRLVYYLNANKMREIEGGKFGLRVVARPEKGFAYYRPAEFHSNGIKSTSILVANETVYIDIILHRFVDKNTFKFSSAKSKPHSFSDSQPSGKAVS